MEATLTGVLTATESADGIKTLLAASGPDDEAEGQDDEDGVTA